jgi:hypothetical protein
MHEVASWKMWVMFGHVRKGEVCQGLHQDRYPPPRGHVDVPPEVGAESGGSNEVAGRFCGLFWVIEVDEVGYSLEADGVVVAGKRDELDSVGAVANCQKRGKLYCVVVLP